jgi:hypothetical protein
VQGKGKAEFCYNPTIISGCFSDTFSKLGLKDADMMEKGATSAYALAILLTVFGGLALVTSFVLLLRELGTINAPGKLLMLWTVVFGWLAVAVGFGSLIGYGTGVHAPLSNTPSGEICPLYIHRHTNRPPPPPPPPHTHTHARMHAHALPPTCPCPGCTRALPDVFGLPPSVSIGAPVSWVDGFALVLTSLLVAFVASIGAVLLLVKGAGGGEPKATPAPASAV